MNVKQKALAKTAFSLLLLGACTVASAQTYDTTAPSTTPGTPNTGVGGNSEMNVVLLLSSGVLALLGAGYLARRYTLS